MESGLLTEEQRELLRSASAGRESAAAAAAAAAEVGSPKNHDTGLKLGGNVGRVSNAGGAKGFERKSHSGRNGRPKKGLPCLLLDEQVVPLWCGAVRIFGPCSAVPLMLLVMSFEFCALWMESLRWSLAGWLAGLVLGRTHAPSDQA